MAAPTTTQSQPLDAASPSKLSLCPPLENRDHLTRDEFERRYEAMPELKKAELIEGVVYLTSRVRLAYHGEQHAELVGWLALYGAYTAGVRVGDNTTVRLDLDNEPQPDAVLLVDPSHGGQAQIDADGFLAGAPELVAEVTSCSASLDLHAKLHVYRRNGVREYLVWRVLDQAIDWFILRQTQYVPLPRSSTGIYQSENFPGLWLDPAALLCGDLLQVRQVLQQGLAGPEHAVFVTRLHQAASTGT
jgi:Uma2 family endonuclease